MDKKDNPPAFPSTGQHQDQNDTGLTLLDYFAAHFVASVDMGRFANTQTMVAHAYEVAEAMLYARKRYIK